MYKKGYGIHNFHLPDDELRKFALGTIAGTPYRLKNVLKVIPPFFQPIDPPDESDWLYNQEQEGQTFDTYCGQMHNQIDQKRNKIYIVPLEANIPKEFLKRLEKYCSAYYLGVKVVIHKLMRITDMGVAERQNNGRMQFNGKDILKTLEKVLLKDAFCMLGVCMTDLYHKQEWNFVFGVASMRQRTGVFSFARYDSRFFGNEQYQPDFDVIFEQAVGVMVHEIGHMFGVRHCIFNKCIMNGSNHLEEFRKKNLEPCPVCLRKLQSNIKFDLYQRYKGIKQVLQAECKGDKAERTLEVVNGILGKLREVFEKEK